MKFILTATLFLLLTCHVNVHAQTVIFDAGHFAIVNENGLYRTAAENTHQNSLQKIKEDLDNINLNLSSVVLVQDMIHQSLATVNATLKNGLAVKQVESTIGDITTQCAQITALARDNPLLLLFAEDVANQMKRRGINLVSEVAAFILKEGDNILMNYEKRDLLLRKVILELQVMRALTYSMYKTMYWTRMNGMLKTANPFQNFVNQDSRIADQIQLQYQILKP
ncbi:hypothetical protein [Mucilaginibacter lacusdianchii]|uniref:hypothetical protein n=1 Tax=Mucilaginibacter lacusdianchii TaxID=2684211 RepID=UPI00131B3E6C|nr:hypothetical protein [Mucilaginibacter sp. JXJ CY 39]